MKILITTDLYLPSVNGVVTSVLSLVHGLEARGHEVRILTLSDTVHTHTEGNVIYLSSFGVGRLYPGIRIRGFCSGTVLRELIRWHPDAVHSQCEFSTFAIARKIARRCGVPLIHTYHTVYEDYTHYFSPSVRMGRAMAARFSRHIANRADAVIAPTEKVRRLLEGYRVGTPVSVIPTGLELSPTAPPSPDGLRGRIGIPKGCRVLLFLGRLAQEKNIPELFRLLACPGLYDAVLVLVGDGPWRAELERQVRRQQLSGRVFFAGMVPHTQVGEYYRLADVFVNASGSETQGLTYIEAMAEGLPVVCRADPCVEGLIENGQTGFACGSLAEMAMAVEELLRNPSLRDRITDTAAAKIRDVYTSGAFAAAVEALYLQTAIRITGRAAKNIRQKEIVS